MRRAPAHGGGHSDAADNAVGLAEALRDVARGTAFDAALAGRDAHQRSAGALLSTRGIALGARLMGAA